MGEIPGVLAGKLEVVEDEITGGEKVRPEFVFAEEDAAEEPGAVSQARRTSMPVE